MNIKFKRKNVWRPNLELTHMRKMMFLSWALSIMIPIILIVMINLITYGTYAINFFLRPDFFNTEVFQLHELKPAEYFRKKVENFIIEDPTEEQLVVFLNEIGSEKVFSKAVDRFDEMVVIVRKNEDLLYLKTIGKDLDKRTLKKFNQLENTVFPAFKPTRETNNEMILDKTGYVISSQQDFYFSDGARGSIFAFQKYTNIPGRVASTVGKNIFYVLLLMFFSHLCLGYLMTKHATKPVQEILLATEEVAMGNYTYQIPLEKQLFLSNISDSINKMISELDKGRAIQEKIDSMQSEFIANVSHDMKTPLTSIKIHAQAIKDGIVTTPDKMNRYLDNILIKSEDMDTMLDELKLYNQLELGTGNYIMQSINFKHFLEDAVEELHYDVASDRVSLNLRTELEAPVLNFDPQKMKRVLNNIIFNAVKYGEVRPLKIELTLIEVIKEGRLCIELRIEDNGVGVANEEYEKLFKQHYRVDPARNQTIAGSGLGLSIAESIINHHGGGIYAQKSVLGGLAIVINLNYEVS